MAQLPELPELPEELRSISLTELKKEKLAQATELKRQVLGALKDQEPIPNSLAAREATRTASIIDGNRRFRERQGRIDEANANSVVGKLGLDHEEYPGMVINQLASFAKDAAALGGNVLQAPLDAYAFAEEASVDAAAKEAYGRYRNNQATDADMDLLSQREMTFGSAQMPAREGAANLDRLNRAFKARGFSEKIDQLSNWDSLAGMSETEERTNSLIRRATQDGTVTAVKGAVSVPEMAVGLADLVSGGHAGKYLEEAGFRPEEAKQFLDSLKTWEQQQADGQVHGAEGFWDTLAEVAENPSTAATAIGESIPAMLSGGLIGRGLQALGMGVKAATAVGEGAVMAGSQAEGIRQQTEDGLLTPKQSVAAGLTGVMGAGVARLGNTVSGRLGLGDIDEAVVAGSLGTSQRGALSRGIGSAAIEGAEETAQSAGEQMLQNVALDRDLTEGVGNAAAMGLVTGAALGGVMGGGSREATPDALVSEAIETGDITPFMQKGESYAPHKAAEVLVERTRKTEDPAERQTNLTQLTEVKADLENSIQEEEQQLAQSKPESLVEAESLVTRLTTQMESLQDESKRPAYEQALATAEQIRSDAEANWQPERARLDALNEQLATVSKAEQTLTKMVDPVSQDIPAQIELADTVIESATPEVRQTARKGAERVVSLAMQSPEALDAEVATRLASNMANSLTEPERVVLRTFAKAKALSHEFKGLEGVSQDIFKGNKKEGYKGLDEYARNVRSALGRTTPDLAKANAEITGLGKFVESRKAKLAVAQNAFDEVAGTGETQQWVPTQSGTWVKADREYSYDEMYEVGGMTIHGGSGGLVARIGQETEALQANLESLKALVSMKASNAPATVAEQPEAAPVEPVATQPVQTVEAEAGIADDAPESVKYRKTNNLKRLFSQQPGDAVSGTQRPLVATENFLTKLSQGEVNALDYVSQTELSEEQLGLSSAFIRMAKAWMPTIEGNFFKRDNPDFFYNDYTQYLQDEQGQVAENVKTAIAASAFAYVADSGGQTLNDNATINKLLGKDADAKVSPKANQMLRKVGTLRGVLVNSLGQAAVQSLGYQLKGDASQSEKAKLEVALGSQVLALLLDQGIVEQSTLTKGELDDLKGVDFTNQIKEMRRTAKTQQDKAAIEGLIKARNNPVSFIRFVTNKDNALTKEGQAIRDASKNTGGMLTKLFGIEVGGREPSFKPLSYDQKTANNSTKPISDKERAALEKEAKAPYVLQKDMWAVLEKISPELALQMAGVRDVDLETLHKTNRDGVVAKNQGLAREWERLVGFVGDLSKQKAGQDTQFFLMPSAWKNDRVGLDSVINPQTSKIHRFVVGKQSAESEVRWTDVDQTSLDVFKLRVAEGLGVKTDKQDNKRSLAAYEAEMQKPVYLDAVAALRKALLDQDLTPGEQQAIVDGVKAGGENFHSLSSLVAQATYENARDAGQKTFTTMLLAEVDGVTNGPMLGHLLFGAFHSLNDAMATLNKGGFFENGSDFENYNLWRAEPGQSDLYESTGIDLNKRVQTKLQDDKLRPMYNALFYVTGRLDDKGAPTKAGRNLMKPPVTKSGYGEGLGKTVETMAEDFIQQVYDHIQEISAGTSKLELKTLLTATHLLINKADAEAATGLNVNMTVQQAMEFTFTTQQFKALKSTYLATLGGDITETIKEAFGPFTERRQAFNQAANLAFDLYQQLYQSKRQAMIQKLIAEGLMATDTKGIPLHDLTKKQEAELQASLTDVAPILHTAFSSASNQLEAGMRLAKRDKGFSDEAAYRNEVKFGKKGKKTMAGLKLAGYKSGEVGPGVSGAVGSVHSTDAAISINAGAMVDSINVHDARIYGLKDVHAGARTLNEQTFLQALNYSPTDEMLATLERTLKGLAEALAQEGDETLKANVASMMSKKGASMHKTQRAAMKEQGVGPIEFQLKQLRATALSAESMKLEILANLQAVDQYAFEGGAYKVTEQDRATAQQKLTERKQHPEDAAATDAAKQLDALLNEQVATPKATAVAQSEPTLVDEADLGIPERQEDSVVTYSAWGELGKSAIQHDSELVQFFKSNPEPSLKDVLKALRSRIEAIPNERSREYNRELFKGLVKNVNPQMKVVYVTPSTPMPEGVATSMAQNARGFYTFSDSMDALYIKGDAFQRSGVTPELLMHELVHSVAARTIDLAEQGKPLPDTIELVGELGTLLEESRKFVAEKTELAAKYVNALNNVQEFVAWGMTNQGFQRDVLNQFTIKTKTSRNVLVKAMEKLTTVLRDILFRGSDKSAQKIQVTGLKTLIANVSGLMATAEQARDVAGTQRTLAMEDPVLDMDVGDLFDALRQDDQPLEPGFENHLRTLLDDLVRPLHGPFGAVRIEALQDQAIGARERFLKALDSGKVPFAAQLSSVVKLSDQEALLAESIELSLRTALESKDRSTSLVYRELKSLYNEVKASLPESAFFEGDWTQASDEQKDQAKALRKFFLEIPEGEGQSDYLSRFAAIGLTYRPLWKLLDRATQKDTRPLAGMSWLERLQAVVERAMKFLAGKITHAWAGQQANDKLKTLVGEAG